MSNDICWYICSEWAASVLWSEENRCRLVVRPHRMHSLQRCGFLLRMRCVYCMLTPAYIENSCQADIKIHHSAYLSMFKRWSMHYLLQCVCYVVFVLVSVWCVSYYKPSVLWRCWLGGRKGIWPIRNWVVGCWRGYLSGARCKLAYGPADATATHCLLLQ